MNNAATIISRKTNGRIADQGLFLGTALIACLMPIATISADNAPKAASPKTDGSPARLVSGSGVPLQINHQGVVQVNNVRFNGPGLFRFAIVDPGPPVVFLWTNDGTSTPGPGTPTAAVSVMVTNGVYSVALGDASLTNMTAIPSTVFNTNNAVLRIWFDDGTNGVQQLTPDHPLSTSPYTFRSVVAGAAEGLNIPGTSTAAVTVDGSGNVGIGTPNPQALLHTSAPGSNRMIVETTGAVPQTGAGIDFYRSTVRQKAISMNGNNDLLIFQGTGSNDSAPNRVFMEGIALTGDTFFGGKVGFGLVNPSARLTIQGTNLDPHDALRIQSNSTKGWNIFAQDTALGVKLRFNDGVGAEGTLSDAGVWLDGSDISYKKDIANIRYGLRELMKLQPREYRMKATNKKQIGFVAQEVETILPELVSGEEGAKGMSYGQLTAVITKAVQQQQVQIEQLKVERAALTEAIKEQNAEIVSMKKRVERLEAQVSRARASR